MATLQSGKCFTVPTFFGMCCRSEWQERMYIYKWHEVDQTKHEIFCVHIVCNEIQVKVNLEITTFFFYLHFPYCPNFFWFGVVFGSAMYLQCNYSNNTILTLSAVIWFGQKFTHPVQRLWNLAQVLENLEERRNVLEILQSKTLKRTKSGLSIKDLLCW